MYGRNRRICSDTPSGCRSCPSLRRTERSVVVGLGRVLGRIGAGLRELRHLCDLLRELLPGRGDGVAALGEAHALARTVEATFLHAGMGQLDALLELCLDCPHALQESRPAGVHVRPELALFAGVLVFALGLVGEHPGSPGPSPVTQGQIGGLLQLPDQVRDRVEPGNVLFHCLLDDGLGLCGDVRDILVEGVAQAHHDGPVTASTAVFLAHGVIPLLVVVRLHSVYFAEGKKMQILHSLFLGKRPNQNFVKNESTAKLITIIGFCQY